MASFSPQHLTLDGSRALDSEDGFGLASEFVIPTKAEIASNRLPQDNSPKQGGLDSDKCIYLCGNSLGLQPMRTATRIRQYLDTWGSQGVHGHFKPVEGSLLPTWLDVDQRASKLMAPIVGAQETEVAVMETLTANLHLLMSAFYQPDINGRHKIILESKAFPSDHFAVETQIRNHGLDPETSMVCIESLSGDSAIITTYDICSTISKHSKTTAVLLLPGIQYYTGQLFDMAVITAFAHKHGVFVIWDLAHAVGNVPLKLHDWDVDAAAWCSYKYLNGGPGCIGGLFVHEKNSRVPFSSAGGDGDDDAEKASEKGKEAAAASSVFDEQLPSPRRLGGWWGNSKETRFAMSTAVSGFRPVAGAAGFQLSNPSVLDMTSLCASLEVFEQAGGVGALRKRSVRLTGYLEALLRDLPAAKRDMFCVVTPEDAEQRGAQISIMLQGNNVEDATGTGDGDGTLLLEGVMMGLEKRGIVVDERRPNVIRVAPAPLYNTFSDVFGFVHAFAEVLGEVEVKR